MKWGNWSTTAASNSAAPPDGWPEGQAPSTVNDCAREMMASIRTGMNDIAQGFIDLGMSPTFVSSTKFTTPSNDLAYLPVGTRLRASDASTLYGYVISASFSTNSAFTVVLDSGNLTSSLTSIAASVIKTGTNASNIPNPLNVAGTLNISIPSTNTVAISMASPTGAAITQKMACSGGAKWIAVNSSSVWYVANSANSVGILTLTDAGALTAAGDITAFSDEKLKSDWKDLPRDFIRQLASIRLSGSFTKDGTRHVGVGAQSLQEIMPDAVGWDSTNEIMTVAYGNAAMATCVELARKVVDLERRLDQVENKR